MATSDGGKPAKSLMSPRWQVHGGKSTGPLAADTRLHAGGGMLSKSQALATGSGQQVLWTTCQVVSNGLVTSQLRDIFGEAH